MTIHQSLQKLMAVINTNETLLNKIISQGKEKFANSEDNINIIIGITNELSIIIKEMDEYAYILNPNLHNLILPIKEYSNNLFTSYKVVNAYKLYDFLSIDLQKLSNFLKNLVNN